MKTTLSVILICFSLVSLSKTEFNEWEVGVSKSLKNQGYNTNVSITGMPAKSIYQNLKYVYLDQEETRWGESLICKKYPEYHCYFSVDQLGNIEAGHDFGES